MGQKYIYFHIATAGTPGYFVEVVHRIMTQIQESGLLQEVEGFIKLPTASAPRSRYLQHKYRYVVRPSNIRVVHILTRS